MCDGLQHLVDDVQCNPPKIRSLQTAWITAHRSLGLNAKSHLLMTTMIANLPDQIKVELWMDRREKGSREMFSKRYQVYLAQLVFHQFRFLNALPV